MKLPIDDMHQAILAIASPLLYWLRIARVTALDFAEKFLGEDVFFLKNESSLCSFCGVIIIVPSNIYCNSSAFKRNFVLCTCSYDWIIVKTSGWEIDRTLAFIKSERGNNIAQLVECLIAKNQSGSCGFKPWSEQLCFVADYVLHVSFKWTSCQFCKGWIIVRREHGLGNL